MSDRPPNVLSDAEAERERQTRERLCAERWADYHPGGMNRAAARRQRARKAGIASGVARKRRATCKRPPRHRSRQQAIALKYKIRQIGAEEFERRYQAGEWVFDRRGLNTCLTFYRALLRSYRAQGQDWETTNGQLARAMELAGRGRCRRTVQRIRKRLVAMGLIAFEHVRRSGALRIAGQLDSLRCRCLQPRGKANVTPPSGAGAADVRPAAAPALPSTTEANSCSVPPPTAADYGGPAAPAESTKEELEARLKFLQLKLDMGFGPTLRVQSDHAAVKRQLAQLDGPGQDTDRTFANRSEGFKWST